MESKSRSSWDGYSLKPRREMPEGLWLGCPTCEHMLFKKVVEENLHVCPECGHHFRIDGPTRIQQLDTTGGNSLADSAEYVSALVRVPLR